MRPVPPLGCHLHCCHRQWSVVFNEGGKVAYSPEHLVGPIPVHRVVSECQVLPHCSEIWLGDTSAGFFLPSVLQFCMSYFSSILLNFAFSLP